jgi:hypothetical protein
MRKPGRRGIFGVFPVKCMVIPMTYPELSFSSTLINTRRTDMADNVLATLQNQSSQESQQQQTLAPRFNRWQIRYGDAATYPIAGIN